MRSGRFASVDDVVVAAVQLLLQELAQSEGPDPIMGLMADDTELMDEIVADAYRCRREESWREVDL